jgi:hypothetical protein
MPLYGLLRRHLPKPAATLAFALIYAALITAVVLLLPVPPADFRYARY